MTKRTSDPVGTITVGNVVSTGTTLYKSNFKRYFQVSLRAAGWSFCLSFATTLASWMSTIGSAGNWFLALLINLVGITFAIYCLARYCTDRAIIARLAYQELIDQPETVSAATQALAPRMWGFLRISLLSGLYLSIVFIVGYILLVIVIGLCMGIATVLNLLGTPLAIVLISLIVVGAILLLLFTIIGYYSSWFVRELPMAIESTTSARVSLRRSKELSHGSIRRLQLIIVVAILITSPINILAISPAFVGYGMVLPSLFPSFLDAGNQSLGYILIVVGILLSIISELFVMPFWQAVTAVIYYDLRNRREGSDLIL
jgi:hypothetical protein